MFCLLVFFSQMNAFAELHYNVMYISIMYVSTPSSMENLFLFHFSKCPFSSSSSLSLSFSSLLSLSSLSISLSISRIIMSLICSLSRMFR